MICLSRKWSDFVTRIYQYDKNNKDIIYLLVKKTNVLFKDMFCIASLLIILTSKMYHIFNTFYQAKPLLLNMP